MTAFDTQALAALRRGLEHFRTRDYFAAHVGLTDDFPTRGRSRWRSTIFASNSEPAA